MPRTLAELVRQWMRPDNSAPLQLRCERTGEPWRECSATGYAPDRPAWLVTWLLIIADNTLHVLCNAAALRWL